MDKIFLGVDVGSVSTNIVIIDPDGQVLLTRYYRNDGQPLHVLKESMAEVRGLFRNSLIRGVGTTGSGRMLAGAILGADIVKNEITAHAHATLHFHPNARTILEIGGQDSKIILIQNGIVVDFAMNTICAAGTGSFLDHQAERLKIPIEQFGELALTAKNKVKIAGRCTVFAESDMIAKQQFGFSKAEIINGLCEALVRNYLNNLARDKQLGSPVIFQGGVAANVGIKAAFERELNTQVIVPENYQVMGAIGAALLARRQIQKTGQQTQFRGYRQLNQTLTPQTFECKGCSNRCEIIQVEQNQKVVAVWGDKCGKHSAGITA
ncbi:MAG TPA: acyl-CoA dehydratase activase [Bacillota bacterium]|nr:acyl-CoA dehydratase activase [Bacillota bacterium]